MRNAWIGAVSLLAALLAGGCGSGDRNTGGGSTGGTGASTGTGTGASTGTGGSGTSDAGGPTIDGGGAGGPYYVAPMGTGTACSQALPCSVTQAQTVVRAAASTMQNDIIVELADGIYTLAAPLVFTTADSGQNGHTIFWQAATGARPVLSGAQKITGWTINDASKNIYKASVQVSHSRSFDRPGSGATRAAGFALRALHLPRRSGDR